jgi:lipid A disaccharide synthetase
MSGAIGPDQLLQAIRREKPDAVILIDSPAFNLRLAKKISDFAPVLYYISPQLWAWGKRRIHIVKKHVREMLVILPFEKEFYEKEGVAVKFVGHPLLDAIPELPEAAVLRSRIEIAPATAASASLWVDTLSPRRSRVAVMPLAFSLRTAATAVSSVSPATKREANREASGLPRMKSNIRCCLLR